jgi:L-seryl-tRNA(Ser) seleniumtransferase
MAAGKATASTSALQNLPSVDELLRSGIGTEIARTAGVRHATFLVRQAIAELRKQVRAGLGKESKAVLAVRAESMLENARRAEELSRTRRVINATGVVIHTNLGRAPLSDAARQAIANAAGYGTLEFDLATGKRGKRGSRVEQLIVELSGAEAALVVNNCAAAAFFVLKAFAEGGEVVVSRGELVEIGGDFRVPDVLSQSGATLREVGTTNRTKFADYQKAISKETRVILRVHPSNYRIVGFTARPALPDLADLAKKHKLLLYEDIGSGALIDLGHAGLSDEPVVARSIADGADVVTFSGDKLLGGPQAGIIAGRKRVIETLRKHPLYRALRADKLVLAGLEATLESYRREPAAEVPVLQMLSATAEVVGARVESFAGELGKQLVRNSNLKFDISDGQSAVGGGAAPAVELKTRLLAITHKKMPAQRIEQLLRLSDPPVIARIVGKRVLIDLRTVTKGEERELLAALAAIA